MALCLAESILDTESLDLEDQLRRYLLWKDSGYLSSNGRCFDIGTTTRTQLGRFRRTGEAIDPQPDEEAAANGSLMRLAAVPIRWHADPATAAERSGESSRTTHAAKRPVDACRLMGAMVSALIGGTAFEDVVAPSFWQWGDLHPAIAEIAGGAWKAKQPPAILGTGYCVDALEAALWSVDGAVDFRDAVLRAANLGDDADTTAAIAGQLAGARWGASAIPDPWRERVVAGERMVSLARGLLVAGGGDAGSTAWAHDEFVHAWWVQPDQLLAGEYPGHPSPLPTRQKVDLLVDAGVRTFVGLTTPADRLEPYEPVVAEVAEARRLDVRHVSFPIPDLGVVGDDRYDQVCKSDRGRSPARRGLCPLLGWSRTDGDGDRLRPGRRGAQLRRDRGSPGGPPQRQPQGPSHRARDAGPGRPDQAESRPPALKMISSGHRRVCPP